VPVSHVRRLLRALEEEKKPADGADDNDGIVVLKPRRPVVGMILGPAGELNVVVKKITAAGPAQKAGIQEGDEILAADGIVIRNVYQAVRPLLYKQPGDVMSFLVRDGEGEVRSVEVVLGGGVLLPSAPSVKIANLIEPKVIVTGDLPQIGIAKTVPRQGGHLAEVAVGDSSAAPLTDDPDSDASDAAEEETLATATRSPPNKPTSAALCRIASRLRKKSSSSKPRSKPSPR
jgi:membrane-associated protease RseP (regulator of RpoE activity)